MSAQGAKQDCLRGAQLRITALALALGTFMQVLDTTIANVSLPTISGYLGASTDQGTWVITSFAVSNGISVPLTGWLMGRFGVVRTFIGSVVLFTIASFLCGTAWSLNSLIVFRVLQGAVSGPMIPGSQALLISIFPAERRATALGIWSITTFVAPIVGPVLGGYISDNYHWGWIFLINVPVGLLTAIICWQNLRKRETPTQKLPIDGLGLAMLAIWVGALQIMLDSGKDADWFSSPLICTEALVSAVTFVAWVIWETTEKRPIVDLSLFRERNFAFGNLALCLGYAVFFGNTLLQPLWMQTNLGYTATWAGLVAAPSGVVAVIVTPLTARLLHRIDARWIATASFVAFAASYFMRAGYTDTASFWDYTLPLLVQGIGVGTFFVSLATISLSGVPPERIPSASGISNFARISGGAFAASLITTFWDRREALHQSRLVDTPTSYNPELQNALERLHHLGLSDLQAYGLLGRELVEQAYLLSSLELFWISGCITVAVIAVIWMARRATGSSGPAGAD